MARRAPYRTHPSNPAAGKPSRRVLEYVFLWRAQQRRESGDTPTDENTLLTEDELPLLTEDNQPLLTEDA